MRNNTILQSVQESNPNQKKRRTVDKTTLRFWLRNDRPDSKGLCPVHIVYQRSKKRTYYAVPGVKLLPINWSMSDQRAIYLDKKAAKKIDSTADHNNLLSGSDAAEINAKLQVVATDISNLEKRFRLDKKIFSPEMVISVLKEQRHPETKKNEPETFVVDFILQFARDSAGTHKPGTLKVYTGLAAHLAAFEKNRHKKCTFESIDVPFLRNFHGFLSEVTYRQTKKGETIELSRNNVTAAKQVSTLKTLLNYARTVYKISVNQDYRDFKVLRKDTDFEVITLTQDEFMEIYNLDLSENKRLDQIRDIFCFSCATGLRFSDLQQLRREHIRKDNTLRMTASKTGQKLVIPLNPISFAILQKYNGHHAPLPMISNQKTNDYIKEIGQLAGIDTPIEKVRTRGVKKITRMFKKYELLSIHVGRKSFITLSLEKGIAIQEVMSLSGHTTFKAFRRYVDVNDARKKSVMATAWGEVPVLKIAK